MAADDEPFDIGDKPRLTATFKLSGIGTNPSAVTLKILKPDGTTTTPSPTSSGSGVYYYDLSIDQAGRWHYRWTGTGTVEATEEGSFVVRQRVVA